MSTRCQILIQEGTKGPFHPVAIYKHSDGYPEGVLPVLVPLASKFFKSRKVEPDYLSAQIVRRFAVDDHLRISSDSPRHKEPYCFIGWGLEAIPIDEKGVITALHQDIEYLYVVNACTGKVVTWQWHGTFENSKRV
jgi:hypothetical protein